ncbi:MAG: hypothetical protein WA958_07605 [Tunicatimonas sp.]
MIAITNKIIEFQLPKLLKKSSVRRKTVNYASAERVGVLVTLHDHEKQHAIDEFVDRLVADHKEVEVLCYDKRRARNKIFGYIQFTSRDISLFGRLRAEYVLDFINRDFDYLFHLDIESEVVLDKILVLSRAKCRVGCDMPEHRDFYELMVRAESLDELSEMIFRYVKLVAVGKKKAL